MKLINLFWVVLCLACSPLFAETVNAVGVVVRIDGNAAQVRGPSSPQSRPLRVGDKVGPGEIIETGRATEIYLSPIPGVAAVMRAESVVVAEVVNITIKDARVIKQTALLNLRSGELVSLLNRERRNINDYGVRTSMGVAAARGTIFASRQERTVTHFVAGGAVTFHRPRHSSLALREGQMFFSASEVEVLEVENSPAGLSSTLQQMAGSAASAASVVAANCGSFGFGPNIAEQELRSVVTMIVKRLPAAAALSLEKASYVEPSQSTNIVKFATLAAGGAANALEVVQAAITAVAKGAARARPEGGESQADAIAQAAVAAAKQEGLQIDPKEASTWARKAAAEGTPSR
jgi:hypothetical protein